MRRPASSKQIPRALREAASRRRRPAAAADGDDLRAALARIEQRLQRIEQHVGGHGVLGRTVHIQQGVASLLRAQHLDVERLPWPQRLSARRFRLNSQNEEDGMTLALLEAAGPGPGRFVEIGCGANGGNSGTLAEELGFAGLMVDADAAKAAEARLRFGAGVAVEQAWVTREELAPLIARHGLDGEVDLLSIDVDGNDIWLWEAALGVVDPRVVIVEYNSLLGSERAVAVPYDAAFSRRAVARAKGSYYGASLAALEATGRRLGYRLVGTEWRGNNAFFVRDDLAPEIPAATAASAFRMLNKHRLLVAGGFDLFAFAAAEDLPLVDVA